MHLDVSGSIIQDTQLHNKQNRVVFVSFSIVRCNAACAAFVMESASSSITILKGGHGVPLKLIY